MSYQLSAFSFEPIREAHELYAASYTYRKGTVLWTRPAPIQKRKHEFSVMTMRIAQLVRFATRR